jgi:hypothetical protein
MPPIALADPPDGGRRLANCLTQGFHALMGLGPAKQDLCSPSHTDWRFTFPEELMQELLIFGLQFELAGFSTTHGAFSHYCSG